MCSGNYSTRCAALALVALCFSSVSSLPAEALPDRLMRGEQQRRVLALVAERQVDPNGNVIHPGDQADHQDASNGTATHSVDQEADHDPNTGVEDGEEAANGNAHTGNPKAEEEDLSSDPYAGRVKNGKCSNWKPGSSVRKLGESNSFYGSHNALKQAACWSKCDDDGACEQAVYNIPTQECWLGTNAMTEDPKAQAGAMCYARNGFGYKLPLHVKEGWCNEFQEGWGGEHPTQCDLESNTVLSQKQCSHWGAEYDLSERGCWVKCQENEKCTQAVYENKDGAWSCFIGTNSQPMAASPVGSRCHDCANRCFAKDGFVGHSKDGFA